jgi:hypothetical protein
VSRRWEAGCVNIWLPPWLNKSFLLSLSSRKNSAKPQDVYRSKDMCIRTLSLKANPKDSFKKSVFTYP